MESANRINNKTILCSYNDTVGWRVVSSGLSKYSKLQVIKIGNIKLLRLPVNTFLKAGYFCNPRKVILL